MLVDWQVYVVLALLMAAVMAQDSAYPKPAYPSPSYPKPSYDSVSIHKMRSMIFFVAIDSSHPLHLI